MEKLGYTNKKTSNSYFYPIFPKDKHWKNLIWGNYALIGPFLFWAALFRSWSRIWRACFALPFPITSCEKRPVIILARSFPCICSYFRAAGLHGKERKRPNSKPSFAAGAKERAGQHCMGLLEKALAYECLPNFWIGVFWFITLPGKIVTGVILSSSPYSCLSYYSQFKRFYTNNKFLDSILPYGSAGYVSGTSLIRRAASSLRLATKYRVHQLRDTLFVLCVHFS